MHPSPIRAQVYQIDDPCYRIGGGVTQIGIKIKDPTYGISRSPTQDTSSISSKWYLQVVSFQQSSDVHQKYKIQVSTIYPKVHTFASIRSIPFMEIDDKGGEIVQRYEAWGEIVQRRRDKI